MENTIKVSKIPTIGLAVIIAVIGFTFAACGDGGGGGGAGHVHDWGEWEITPATCIDKGLKTRACILDPSHTQEEEIPKDPNGHDFGDSETVTREPTCDDEDGEGEAEGTCILCGKETTKTLAKLDHDYDYDDDEDGWEIITKANFTTQLKKARICKRNTSHKGEPITGETLPYFSSVEELGDYLETYDSPTSVTNPYTINLQTDDLTGIRDALGGATGDKYVHLDLTGSTLETIPANTFGASATDYTAALVGVTIPDGVTTIETGAFWNCTNLTNVTIPDSVITIGGGNSPINGTFRNCTSLTSITIPDSVTSIGAAAFYYCSSLTSITIPDSVTTIESSTFSGCTSLTSVTIGSGVTSIGTGVFNNCTSLTSVTIGSGVTSIGTNVFNNCTSLTHLTINCNIPANNAFGFQSLTNLTTVTIGSSVTSIGDNAFYGRGTVGVSGGTGCFNIYRVIIEEGSTLQNIPDNAFPAYNNSSHFLNQSYSPGRTGIWLRQDMGSWGYGGKKATITLPAANVTTLTEGVWIDGNLPENSEKLYKFTATTTDTQYIHFYFGTLPRATVAAYDSEGYMMYPGESIKYLGSYTYDSYHSVRITSGQTYYINVKSYSDLPDSPYSGGSGTYKITFNTSDDTPPAITLPTANVTTLTEGVWENGDLPQYGDKWYKFTAMAGTQYIHASFGTLTNLFVQTYNSDGTKLATGGGSSSSIDQSITRLSVSTTYGSRTVTTGQTYYIRVVPFLLYSGDGYSGTYKIAFNQSYTAPAQ